MSEMQSEQQQQQFQLEQKNALQQPQQQQQIEIDQGLANTGSNNMISNNNHANSFPTHHRRSRTRNFENPPQPHMCIKEKTIEGHEIFINVMSWTRIVNPNNAEAPIPLYGGMRVHPASPRSPSLVYAVMASPEVLKKSGRKCSDTPERMYLIDLMCEFVEAMNPGLHLSRKPEILKDRDLSGELKDVWSAVQAIRNKERVENIINTTENLVVYTEFGPRSPSYEQSAMITPPSQNQNVENNQDNEKDPKKFNFDEYFQYHLQQKDNPSAIIDNNTNGDDDTDSLDESFAKKMHLDDSIMTPANLQPSVLPLPPLSTVNNKILPEINSKSDNIITISTSTIVPSSPKSTHNTAGNEQKPVSSPNKITNNNNSTNNNISNNNSSNTVNNKKESQSSNFFPKFRSSKINQNNQHNNTDDTNNSSATNTTTTPATTNNKEVKEKDNKKGLNFFRRNKSSKNNDNENKIVIQENNKNLDDSSNNSKDLIDATATSPQTTTASVVPLIAK